MYIATTYNLHTGSGFSIKEIDSVFNDKNIESLWDKPPKKLSTNQMTILRKACTSKFLIIYGPPGKHSQEFFICFSFRNNLYVSTFNVAP